MYITDNQNVRSWIKHRYSKHPVIQYLIRLLGIQEIRRGFQTYSAYARTWRNKSADGTTREDWELELASLEAKGFKRVSGLEGWKNFLEEFHRAGVSGWGVLAIWRDDPVEMKLAQQMFGARQQLSPTRTSPRLHRSACHLIEVGSSFGTYAESWESLGL